MPDEPKFQRRRTDMIGNAAGVVASPGARQSFATEDLQRKEVETIASGRMSSEHDHLDALAVDTAD